MIKKPHLTVNFDWSLNSAKGSGLYLRRSKSRNRGFAKSEAPAGKFYETAEFRALHREWTERLALSGFRDIETADGTQIHADSETDLEAVDPELEVATRERAQDALSDEMLWRRRPARARRLLALVVSGMPVKTAGRLLGLSERATRAMHQETLMRIGS